MSTRYEPPRRRAREAPVLLLVLALLAAIGVLVSDPFRPATALTGAAARWAPGDATRAYAAIEGSGQEDPQPGQPAGSDPAMVENARLSPRQGVEAIGAPAYQLIPRGARRPTQWWRETLFASGWTDAWRDRLRGLDRTGTITRSAQTWGDRGLVFAPGLLELPADAAAGERWTSEGEVASSEKFGIGRYRNTSSATAAGECLHVVSDTELVAEQGTPYRWHEENTWCPGRGVVAERGSTDLGPQPLTWTVGPGEPEPVKPERFTAPRVPVDRLDSWRGKPMTGVRGDATFGFDQGRDQTLSVPAGAVTSTGVVALPAAATPEVTTLEPTDNQRFLLPTTRLRPGGAIQNLTALGSTVAVSTTDRRLQLYHPGGYQLWNASLPDVSSTGPVRVGTDRIVIATLGGSVLCLDLATGVELWRHQLDAGVTLRPASDGTAVAVADEQHSLTVLDAATGTERWQQERPFPIGALTIANGILLIETAGRVTATRLSDEQFQWEASVPVSSTLAVTDTRVVAASDTETVLLDPANGRRLGSAPGSRSLLAVADLAFLITGDTLTAIGPDGRPRGSWPVSPGTGRGLQVSGAGIWVFGRNPEWTVDLVGP